MLLVGENSKKTIDNYSNEFLREFVNLLKTSHGEKKVHLNHFYQEVIANRHHIHMNSTKWTSLTQFAGHLSREGICRLEETEKGLFISWIDNSPETLRRREAVMKKERQDKGDEEREQKQILEQVERARKAELAKTERSAATKSDEDDKQQEEEDASKMLLERKDGDKLKLNFGAAKPAAAAVLAKETTTTSSESPSEGDTAKPAEKLSMSFSSKPKNVFAAKKTSNPLAANKKSTFMPQKQKVSQQELIMRKEMEQQKKRTASGNVFEGGKRMKIS